MIDGLKTFTDYDRTQPVVGDKVRRRGSTQPNTATVTACDGNMVVVDWGGTKERMDLLYFAHSYQIIIEPNNILKQIL